MKQSTIYGARCVIDNKWYIGKTDRSLEDRIKEHERAASTNAPDLFHKTMRDMGLRNFEWKELGRCSKEEVFELEKKWINDLGAESIEILNTTHARKANKPAGSVIKPRVQSAIAGRQAWQKLSARKWMQLSGRLMPVINLNTGEKYASLLDTDRKSPDRRPGIKKSCETGLPTIRGNRYAYLDMDGNPVLQEGHKKALPRNQRVKNLNTGIIYDSIAEAANTCGASRNMVQATCTGKYKTARGIPFCYVDDNDKEILTETHRRFQTEVEQKRNIAFAAWKIDDTNREKMIIFDTTKELGNIVGINETHILAICRGDRQHDHGWRVAFYNKATKELDLKQSHSAKIKKRIRRVMCLDDNNVFDNVTEAAKNYGLVGEQIRQCCEGVLKSTGRGKVRRRFAYLNERGDPILTNKHKELPEWLGDVRLFCPQTGKTYQSVAHCSRETGIPQKRIRRYLKDNSVNIGGFVLMPIQVHKSQ